MTSNDTPPDLSSTLKAALKIALTALRDIASCSRTSEGYDETGDDLASSHDTYIDTARKAEDDIAGLGVPVSNDDPPPASVTAASAEAA